MIDAMGSRVRVLSAGFIGAAVLLAAVPGEAQARVRHVPDRYATIQAAVDAADPGDVIDVGAGQFCGATLDRPVDLRGHGRATIIGCADGPVLSNGVRTMVPPFATTGTRIVVMTADGSYVERAKD